jgi:hypothetical protein
MMGNLDPDHGVIDTDEKVQKIAQIRFMDNRTLEQVLLGLGWFHKYLDILGAYRCINFFTGFDCIAVGCRTQHLFAELGAHINLV